MPYLPHDPPFNPPGNAAATIWRYLDFAKFVSMLENSALYFCRVAELLDPHEGRFLREELAKQFDSEMPEESRREDARWDKLMEDFARNYYVNCWHMNEEQCIAMWQYGQRGDYGIALRSDFTRLCRALEASSRNVHIGAVSYSPDQVPVSCLAGRAVISTFSLTLRKRSCWEYEHELRAVVHLKNDPEDAELPRDGSLRYGIAIKVCLSELIESVYVAPKAPPWFVTLVEALMRRYGLLQPVIPSDLLDEPPSLLADAE